MLDSSGVHFLHYVEPIATAMLTEGGAHEPTTTLSKELSTATRRLGTPRCVHGVREKQVREVLDDWDDEKCYWRNSAGHWAKLLPTSNR